METREIVELLDKAEARIKRLEEENKKVSGHLKKLKEEFHRLFEEFHRLFEDRAELQAENASLKAFKDSVRNLLDGKYCAIMNLSPPAQEEEPCQHEIEQLGGGTYCPKCHEDFGWYCPDSPDRVCHYESYWDGRDYCVNLIDGSAYVIPQHWGELLQDQCLFCGQPEERVIIMKRNA